MASKSQRAKRRSDRLALLCETNPQSFALECDTVVEFQAAAGDKKLPTFSMTAYTGGRMMPRGFSIPVVADLMSLKIMAGPRPIFMNHDPNRIVGHATVKVEGRSIKVVDGVISGAGQAAEEVRASSANGFPWKASIGGNPERMEFVEATKQVEVNGQKFNGPLYVARGVSIHEVSFVPLAGDNRTSATVAASFNTGDSPMTFEAWLQANGFDIATLTDGQKTKLKAAFEAEMKLAAGGAGGGNPTPPNGNGTPAKPIVASGGGDDEEDNPILARRQLEAAEATRIDAIHALFAKPEYAGLASSKIKTSAGEFGLKAHAIAEGWTADTTELAALRASRPAPAIHSKSHDTDATLQALQGAMILRAGLTLDHRMFATPAALAMKLPSWLRAGLNSDQRQKAMEAAWRYRDMSMYDVAIEAIRIDGGDVLRGTSREETIQAAFSGSSLSNIFTTNVNAVILSTYMEAPDTTGGWVREAEVANFLTNERPRMTKGPNLTKLPAGQTADHATRSDLVESYKIARYAKQFVVDEQDFINDVFNAMMDTPQEMGLAARRLRPDLVYYILLSNPELQDAVALFHAASHGNLNTTSALAATTLKAAIADIELQQENGVNLNLKASHLIVPPSLKHAGAELINSSTIQISWGADDETLKERGTLNTINSIESLTLVSDARLENGVTDPSSGTAASGSATTWFMAAAMAHTIEVGYLRGTGRVPSVRSFPLDRGQWGLGWDVKMDLGAKALDYRGLHKNTA